MTMGICGTIMVHYGDGSNFFFQKCVVTQIQKIHLIWTKNHNKQVPRFVEHYILYKMHHRKCMRNVMDFLLKNPTTKSIYLTYHFDILYTNEPNGNLIINHLFKFNGWITMPNNVFNCAYINRENLFFSVYGCILCDVYEMFSEWDMLKRSHINISTIRNRWSN